MYPPLPNPSVQPSAVQFGPEDLIRRSASSVPAPARQLTPVAKLIDVSKCIGCKACQVACLEWNDMREEVGVNHGPLRQPARPDAEHLHAHALHRVGEPGDRQSRMADPQGRLHALRRSGLPEGLPGARRHRAVFERHRRFRARELHRLRLLREGMSRSTSRASPRSTTRPTNARCAPTAWRSGRGRPAPRPARPRPSSSAPRRR